MLLVGLESIFGRRGILENQILNTLSWLLVDQQKFELGIFPFNARGIILKEDFFERSKLNFSNFAQEKVEKISLKIT